MRVYISGPMSGLPNYNREAFHDMERHLLSLGHRDIFNPANLPPGHDWQYYMAICLEEVAKSHRIIMLAGWDKSLGACMEHALAVCLKLQIIKQGGIEE